jgi:TctA family transporter
MPPAFEQAPGLPPAAATRRTSDVLLGALSLICGGVVLAQAWLSPDAWASPMIFPCVIAVLLMLAALALVARGVFFARMPEVRWHWQHLVIAAGAVLGMRLALDHWAQAWMLRFGPAEFTALTVVALAIALLLARLSRLRALAMLLIGMLLATIGIDVSTGEERFTFGLEGLQDGLSFIEVALGLLVIGDAVVALASPSLYGAIYASRIIHARAPRLPFAVAIGLRVVAVLAIAAAIHLTYELNRQILDIYLVLLFGAFGVAAKLLGWNRIVLCYAVLQTALLEENIGRALQLAQGDPTIFLHSPISTTLMVTATLIFATAALLSARDATASSLRAGSR